MSGVNEIRSTFLNYFNEHGHSIVDSGPLVPRNDPTLMFTNAGMVQFKNVFTGLEQRDYSRAVTSQKCVRAGGKHNDLDNVGYTARHHTFFEMLGNFSFGDYFKENAIELAWNLITKEFDLPADKLLVTVYHEDDEAFDLWKKIAGLSDNKIIRIPTSDNFWSMGETGPCGPCSEIFYDHGDHIWGGPPGSPEEDGDRFIEIWNLVFMQYEQLTKDERVDLPRPSIDTGMGLERIAAVLQGTHDNYETDLFRALIQNSVDLTGVDEVGDAKASHRVIADHLRSTSFLIADGVLPSSDGRGYVLRRIMRRAMRHARLLGSQDPIIYKMVPTLVREMGQAFPELVRAEALITETLKLEESRFGKTLSRGLQLLDDATDGMDKGDSLDGETAFKLYDTYGFPLDLTQDALRARSIEVDVDGFDTAMARQKAEARANWAGSGEAATDAIWFDVSEKVGATDFLGYDRERTEGAIVALVKDGAEVDNLKAGDEASIILNQTPFYGESGGQIGDTGVMIADGIRFEVSDTVKKNHGMFVHMGKLIEGSVKIGDALELVVDHERRSAIRANHSATHLLHEALRETLGDHVAQKGSFVTPERLRFDFSHQKPVTDEEVSQVEEMVNEIVLQNGPVETRIMAVDDAIEAGAMALFGEKYGDEVRVVSMGEALRGDKAGKTYSVELCGGTHVNRTGDVGLMTIVSESAVAAGVRRIEALTGKEARTYLQQQDERVREAAGLLKVAPNDLVERLEALVADRRKLEKELADVRRKLAMGGSGSGGDAVKEVNGVKFLARVAEGISPKDLKGMVDQGKESIGSGVVVMIAVSEDGKVGVVVGVTDDLTDRFNAVDMVKVAAEALGGRGGGGRPDMAQAGGKDADKANDAIAAIEALLS
ncbi:alanyl-tRNA synthetase [Cohaesibacter marisflavi]|uniref:Alanine--tRNA ligase n=1 Tax=Cohaesibacter marisflavi TaxID=655353 RepID=A0A1I5J2Q7_9HYPH|nr:alanine--tRNA ligase [Cohaesibacter marisflavi]SFO67037.1 alanyl-tRNA synthetase [Cohaesibacter marisflavi]